MGMGPEMGAANPEAREAGGWWGGTRWAWVVFLVLILLLMGTWGGQLWGV